MQRRPDALAAWVAADPASLRLLEIVRKVAATSSTVMIRGESGTGKELLAQVLHLLGANAAEPFVKIDCASLPADLLESELFGYERGAFTGADSTKPGRLELAGRGTLVLDEVAALGMGLQAKLLRVIEEKSFERLGGHATVHIQARLLALSNVDLERAVTQHSFREDLFYRLNVVPLQIPALRDRRGDVAPLTEAFLHRLREVHRRPSLRLDPAVLQVFERYAFPGNVRELRNTIERAVIYAAGDPITPADLPPHLAARAENPTIQTLEDVERAHIAAVLHQMRGKKSESARLLGISRKTLLEKRKRYQLD
ncbi:MAG: sigma-54 interaction domain-containing protein [Terriglobales bacterium]